MTTDPALDTLLLPLATGAVARPGRVLFLRARAAPALGRDGLVCQQGFRPFAVELERAGFAVTADVPAGERFPLVLVLPPRQREEARALLARAVTLAEAGGVVLAASTNTEGAKSHEADLAALCPLAGSLSKNKARAYWTRVDGWVDGDRLTAWAALDAPRPIADGRFLSRPGLFAWDRIDPGSALLARHLPPDLKGRAADLGAGFGYLSAELLARCPGITALDLYEAEARALELARVNLRAPSPPRGEGWGEGDTPLAAGPEKPAPSPVLSPGGRGDHTGQPAQNTPLTFHWHDVTAGLPARYDVIVSNPPFHVGRADDAGLGQAFIRAAAEALVPGGQLWLVANRHLPYEAVLAERFGQVRAVAEEAGYKVIRAADPRRTPKGSAR